jgi:hypothetical protein
MINDQSYTWIYIGFYPKQCHEDCSTYKTIKSTHTYFKRDYDAIIDGLQYKMNSEQYPEVTSIQLFLITINRQEEKLFQYVTSC